MSVEKRKKDHIEICLNKVTRFNKKNGFEKYELLHQAIADFNFDDVDLSCNFLGKKLSYPLIISSMTGGCGAAKKINTNLALAANKLNIAMSCGSQKAMIKDQEQAYTYEIRDVAPGVLYIGNIGLDYLKNRENIANISSAVTDIKADALFVHLNLAQELVQSDGERDFTNSMKHLADFIEFMEVPVLAKEVGFGISQKTAIKLENAGVAAIDVAGSGGTSWTKVESFRSDNRKLAVRFSEWGIPTAESLAQCRNAVKIPLIASGGIYDGIMACKALALGADLVGIAGPLLAAASGSSEKVTEYLGNLVLELKTAMMLVGARNVNELKNKKEIIYKIA